MKKIRFYEKTMRSENLFNSHTLIQVNKNILYTWKLVAYRIERQLMAQKQDLIGMGLGTMN